MIRETAGKNVNSSIKNKQTEKGHSQAHQHSFSLEIQF